MTAVKYAWKEGSPFTIPPEKAGPVLQRFAERGYTAADVLARARKPAPDERFLRKALWLDRPDSEVAEVARLDRARLLMRSIVVFRPGDTGPRRLTVAIYKAKLHERIYADRAGALEDPFERKQVVEEGNRKLREFLVAYGDLQEFASVVASIRFYLAGEGGAVRVAGGAR